MVTQPRWLRAMSVAAASTLFASALIAGASIGAQADTVTSQGRPATVSSTSLPTVQVDGVIWDQVVVGTTVYAAGSFTTAYPAGSTTASGVAKSNMLAYDIRTGALIPSFSPTFNSQIRGLAASPDGKRIYAVGSFTRAGGVAHDRLAAINATTGAVISTFVPDLNAQAYTVTVSGSSVYVGGQFTTANGESRTRVAAFDATTGALLPFAPVINDHAVKSMLVSPDGGRVLLAGDFIAVNGSSSPGYGMGVVDAATGLVNQQWDAGTKIKDGGDNAAIWSVSSDGTSVYGTGYTYGSGGNLEGMFKASWADGSIQWVEDCHGDAYDSTSMGGVVYQVGHSHECQTVDSFPQTDPWRFQRAMAWTGDAQQTITKNLYSGYTNWEGQPAPRQLTWYPDIASGKITGQDQGAWTVESADGYVVIGGEFPSINGTAQAGLARFATTAIAPDLDGPRISGAAFRPNAVSHAPGEMTVTWRSNFDRDDPTLTYKVYRNGSTTTPIYTTTGTSRIWFDRPVMRFTDRGLKPGTAYSYRITATDPAGNLQWSSSVVATVATTQTPVSAYDSAVVADGAREYWRFDDPAGSTTAADSAGPDDLVSLAGVTYGSAGAGTTVSGATFNGTATGLASSQMLERAPDTFSVEAWFKTTTTAGGKIVGYGAVTGRDTKSLSATSDRQIFMAKNGTVAFGVNPGTRQMITTSSALNDGQWHHAVGTLGTAGMRFYVDGKLVGVKDTVTSGANYYGYWRVGGDNLSGWTSGASNFFAGDIDDVAVYGAQIPAATVRSHWGLAGNAVAPAPAGVYAQTVSADEPAVYWRLGEASGPVAQDSSGNGATGAYSSGVQLGAQGGVVGAADTAAQFDGGSGTVASTTSAAAPSTFSEELWFKTTSTAGGRLIGYGSAQTGLSGTTDRQIWMTRAGRLSFGVATTRTNTAITSSAAYNDGAWHQVVATSGTAGMQLYVDGVAVASGAAVTARDYTAWLRVGGDTLSGWDTTASRYFAGTIDEVSVYGSVLSSARVAAHYAAGTNLNSAPVASFTSAVSGLTAAFDGTSSTDADGSVVSYAWDFGDGTTSLDAKPSHTYAAAGDRTVTLTVTDNGGASGSVSKTVTPVRINQAPVAAFTQSVLQLAVAFDGSGSADPDGTIASYTWSFGDGTSGTDAKPNHTYASGGDKTVTLTVTDNDGATTSVTRVVTVVAPNQLPTAAFAVAVSGATASLDGSVSADPDGTIASYAWDFGDGTTSSGVSTSHAYTSGGDKSVTLTVTDDEGATASVTKTVTVSAPVSGAPFAKDGFGRTVSGGFGTADTGGAWILTGAASSFSVGSGAGSISTAKGATLTASLPSVSSSDTDVTATFTVPQLPIGGNVWAGLVARSVGTDDYSGIFTVNPAGQVAVQGLHGKTSLQSVTASGVRLTAGSVVRLRVQAVGTGSTAVKVRFWLDGTAEPTTWQVSTTDSTAGLQAAGAIGIRTYAGGAVTNGPIVFKVGDLTAASSSGAPAANRIPVAEFASSVNGLSVSLDGSGSSDPDGSVASYDWDFGDGSAHGSGPSPSHSYATAGDKTVKLTVTDDRGAIDSVTHTVTAVAAPPAGSDLAKDGFGRAVSGGFGSADTGGSWTLTGSASSFSVGSGAGSISTAKGATLTASLGSVSSSDTDVTATFTVPNLPVGGNVWAGLVARSVGSDDYSGIFTLNPAGQVSVQALHGKTALQSATASGVKLTAGSVVHLRVQAVGTGSTAVKVRFWLDGSAEPTTWNVSSTDTTAALQTAGAIGIRSYAGGAVTNGPIVFKIDDLIADPS